MDWLTVIGLLALLASSLSGLSLKCGEEIIIQRGEKKVLRFWSSEDELLNVDVLTKAKGGGYVVQGAGGGSLGSDISASSAFDEGNNNLRTNLEEFEDEEQVEYDTQKDLYYGYGSRLTTSSPQSVTPPASGGVEAVVVASAEGDQSTDSSSSGQDSLSDTSQQGNTDRRVENKGPSVNTVFLDDSIIYDYRTGDETDEYHYDDPIQVIPVENPYLAMTVNENESQVTILPPEQPADTPEASLVHHYDPNLPETPAHKPYLGEIDYDSPIGGGTNTILRPPQDSPGPATPTTLPHHHDAAPPNTQSQSPEMLQVDAETQAPVTLQNVIDATSETLRDVTETPSTETLREVTETPSPETLREMTETPSPETLRDTTNTPSPETLREVTETPSPETLSGVTETLSPETLRDTTNTPSPETLREATDTTPPEVLREVTDTPSLETLREVADTTSPETLRDVTDATPADLRDVTDTPSPEILRDVTETPSLEILRDVTETPSPEIVKDATNTPYPETLRDTTNTPYPETLREVTETPSPETLRDTTNTPSPETLREATTTPSSETLREVADTTSPETLREVTDATPADLQYVTDTPSPESRQEVTETPSPETLREVTETLSPETLREVTETLSPETLRVTEAPSPEMLRDATNTPSPETLRGVTETLSPEALREVTVTTPPEGLLDVSATTSESVGEEIRGIPSDHTPAQDTVAATTTESFYKVNEAIEYTTESLYDTPEAIEHNLEELPTSIKREEGTGTPNKAEDNTVRERTDLEALLVTTTGQPEDFRDSAAATPSLHSAYSVDNQNPPVTLTPDTVTATDSPDNTVESVTVQSPDSTATFSESGDIFQNIIDRLTAALQDSPTEQQEINDFLSLNLGGAGEKEIEDGSKTPSWQLQIEHRKTTQHTHTSSPQETGVEEPRVTETDGEVTTTITDPPAEAMTEVLTTTVPTEIPAYEYIQLTPEEGEDFKGYDYYEALVDSLVAKDRPYQAGDGISQTTTLTYPTEVPTTDLPRFVYPGLELVSSDLSPASQDGSIDTFQRGEVDATTTTLTTPVEDEASTTTLPAVEGTDQPGSSNFNSTTAFTVPMVVLRNQEMLNNLLNNQGGNENSKIVIKEHGSRVAISSATHTTEDQSAATATTTITATSQAQGDVTSPPPSVDPPQPTNPAPIFIANNKDTSSPPPPETSTDTLTADVLVEGDKDRSTTQGMEFTTTTEADTLSTSGQASNSHAGGKVEGEHGGERVQGSESQPQDITESSLLTTNQPHTNQDGTTEFLWYFPKDAAATVNAPSEQPEGNKPGDTSTPQPLSAEEATVTTSDPELATILIPYSFVHYLGNGHKGSPVQVDEGTRVDVGVVQEGTTQLATSYSTKEESSGVREEEESPMDGGDDGSELQSGASLSTGGAAAYEDKQTEAQGSLQGVDQEYGLGDPSVAGEEGQGVSSGGQGAITADAADDQGQEYSESRPEYSEGKPEYSEGRPENSEGRPEYSEGRPEYSEVRPEYSEGRPEYSEGRPEYSESRPEYSEGGPENSEGRPEYSEGRPEYSEGRPEYSEGGPEDSEGRPEYSEGRPEDSEGKPEYSDGRPEYSENRPEYSEYRPDNSEGRPEYNEGRPQYNEGRPEDGDRRPAYSEGRLEYGERKPEYSEDRPQYSEGRPQYSEGRPEYNEGRPQYSDGRPQYNEGRPQYSEGRPQYSEGRPQYSESSPQYNEGRPQYSEGRPQYSGGRPEDDEGRPEEGEGGPGVSKGQSPTSRREDAGQEDFGGDTSFFIKLPGSPDVVPVFLQYEPIQIKYVPSEEMGLGAATAPEGSAQGQGWVGVQEQGGATTEKEFLVTEALKEMIDQHHEVRTVEAGPSGPGQSESDASLTSSFMSGIYRILDDVSAAVNTYQTEEQNTYQTGGQNTYQTGGHNTYQTGGHNTYQTGGHDTYQTEGLKEPNPTFTPHRPVAKTPDPFFLMDPPQLGNNTTAQSPHSPGAGSNNHQDSHNKYTVQLSSKLDIEDSHARPGEGDSKGTVEDVPLGKRQEILYPGDYYTHNAFTGINLTSLVNPVFDLSTKPTTQSVEERMNPQYTPFPITTNPPRTRFTTTLQDRPSTPATTPMPINPPPQTSSSSIPPTPPSASPTATKTLSSVEFSPIPAVNFEDHYDSVYIPEYFYDDENAIVAPSPSSPQVIEAVLLPTGSGGNEVRRVSAAPFKISNEAVPTLRPSPPLPASTTTTTASPATIPSGEMSASTKGDGLLAPTEFTAHQQVYSFPQSREDPEDDPRYRFVDEDSDRVYTAFYSPREIPGVDPSLFRYRKVPRGYSGIDVTSATKNRPSAAAQSAPPRPATPAHHWSTQHLPHAADQHVLGPHFFKYLSSLPYAILHKFRDPTPAPPQERLKRAAPKQGEQIFCEWNIKTEPGLYLLMTFHNLSAAYTVDCHGAYIEVERENNGFDARWCGNRVSQSVSRPHVIFAKTEVRITVYDDGDVDKNLPTGFEADIEVIDLFDARDYTAFMRSNAYPHIRRLLLG